MINRPFYLNQIIRFKDTEFIKVITGIRRCGKSYLLQLYRQYLLDNGVTKEQILYLNFEDYDNLHLQNDKALYKYLKEKALPGQKMYFLFDEIQIVVNWQKLVNSLRVSFHADVTVTGSNAKMLSSEIATFLSGRYIEIKVYPLSFEEFLLFKNVDKEDFRNIPKCYKEYVKYGGFPAVVLADEELKETILSGIFDTVLLNDVGFRSGIKEPQSLRLMTKFLSSNVGQTVNPTIITNTLKSAGVKATNPTVNRYLSMLEDAYLFYKADKYDIRGKEYLRSKGKYFIADTGLRHIALARKQDNRGSELENIVYLELRRRGYSIDVGNIDADREVDFIARKMNEIIYVQVAYQLPETSKRETDNLLKIADNYKKIVITERFEDETNIDGIPIINVMDWLLGVENC